MLMLTPTETVAAFMDMSQYSCYTSGILTFLNGLLSLIFSALVCRIQISWSVAGASNSVPPKGHRHLISCATF